MEFDDLYATHGNLAFIRSTVAFTMLGNHCTHRGSCVPAFFVTPWTNALLAIAVRASQCENSGVGRLEPRSIPTSLGHEAFNFLPLNGHMLGYFQPRLDPNRSSSIALERIESGCVGEELKGVLAVGVATDPKRGGQCVIGWFGTLPFIATHERRLIREETPFPTSSKQNQKTRSSFRKRNHVNVRGTTRLTRPDW